MVIGSEILSEKQMILIGILVVIFVVFVRFASGSLGEETSLGSPFFYPVFYPECT